MKNEWVNHLIFCKHYHAHTNAGSDFQKMWKLPKIYPNIFHINQTLNFGSHSSQESFIILKYNFKHAWNL